jgi:glycerate 2-kinase
MNAVLQPSPASSSLAPAAVLRRLMDAALQAADPLLALPRYLPTAPKGRTVVIGAGKASARMALALERHWPGELQGLVVTRYGHSEPTERISIVEAGHPVPDAAGASAARRIMSMVQGLTADDLVIALISGGGSSLLAAPIEGMSLDDKRSITQSLLASGATISEMNAVRKALSAVKGGKLGALCGKARVCTLVVSDVPGDDPAVVASGPTQADATTLEQVTDILNRYGIQLPGHVWSAMRAAHATRVDAAQLGERSCHVIATPQMALEAAAEAARAMGIAPMILGDALEGEARHVGTALAGIARQVVSHHQPLRAPCVLLSGGETTVTLRGKGRGGRNAEYLLAHAIACSGLSRVWGLAIDTDGIDGSENNAGASFGPETLARARAMGLLPETMLAHNDAYTVFERTQELIITRPTRTNVNDFRATLIV